MSTSRYLAIFFSVIGLQTTLAGQLILNEAVSSNVDGLLDYVSDKPDWIEIWNAGPTAVDLSGYGV